MNHQAERRNRQPLRRQPAGSESFCPLCRQSCDEHALYAHLDQQHGDHITKGRQEDPDFDVQGWKDKLKSLASAKRYETLVFDCEY